MPERRTPYLTTGTIQFAPNGAEAEVLRLRREVDRMWLVIQALLEREGREACPRCGYRLREDEKPNRPK